ncbi:MAG: Trk system potassium transporter TrkA [Planctomycetota bacterium]|nr:MAG: Trk system potassium transporter TrkA [Planctomycetota bacterium]
MGGGTVGASIAASWCERRHSVTVVDLDPDVVHRINEEMDVRALRGSAAQSNTLFQAGAFDADLCLAVTNTDEVNLTAASVAKAMGTRRAVARVYSPVFLDTSTFDYQRHFKIDRLVSLEQLSAIELARVVRHPSSIAVENLARGELEMQDLAVTGETSAVGVPLKNLRLGKGVRVGSIYRDGELFIASADDEILVGDRITLLGKPENLDRAKSLFEVEPPQKLGIVIAGGGETGFHLARLLDGPRQTVVIMESDRGRCDFLAAHLEYATVVHTDVRRRVSLEEERVGSADIFVACTGDDENNIVACVEAKELGAKRVAAVVERPDYGAILSKLGIDHVVSPRRVVAREIEAFLNPGVVVSRRRLMEGTDIEIVELEVLEGAAATEHVLAAVPFPDQCLIAAIIREGYAFLPGADDRLEPGDIAVALAHESVVDELAELMSGGAG